MRTMINKYKREINIFGMSMVFLIGGMIILEGYSDFTGSASILISILTFLYLIFSQFFGSINLRQPKWMRKEVWAFSILVGFLCVLGIIETYTITSSPSIVFIGALVFVLVFNLVNYNKVLVNYNKVLNENSNSKNSRTQKLIEFSLGVIFVGLSVTLLSLVIFEYELEATILSFFYFGGLFILGVRWLIGQMKLIINLKNEKKKTELLHLKSQVNPHFFFNMLNNLYGLVDKDTKKARSLILKLSEMMRYSIYEGEREWVTVEEEVEHLQNFIELHQMRYHKEIDVQFEIKLPQKEKKVMPLLFIILLENAFKHGVENLRKNAYVRLSLSTRDKEVIFEIENNVEKAEEVSSSGIGLKNLKRRLELAYPNRHTLTINEAENLFKVQLMLKEV